MMNYNYAFSISDIQKTLAGVERHLSLCADDLVISTIKCDGNVLDIVFLGHEKEKVELWYWIDEKNNLHIENGRTINGVKEEIYDYAEEEEWTPSDIRYIKSGSR